MKDVHHIHVWSMDGVHHYITLHVVVSNVKDFEIKSLVKEKLETLGITHATVEMELPQDDCHEKECTVSNVVIHHHHH